MGQGKTTQRLRRVRAFAQKSVEAGIGGAPDGDPRIGLPPIDLHDEAGQGADPLFGQILGNRAGGPSRRARSLTTASAGGLRASMPWASSLGADASVKSVSFGEAKYKTACYLKLLTSRETCVANREDRRRRHLHRASDVFFEFADASRAANGAVRPMLGVTKQPKNACAATNRGVRA